MYVSKTTKRNIILMIVFVLIAGGVAAFLLMQKPKIEAAAITGSGYTGSAMSVSVLPLDATVTYQWKGSDSPSGPFTDITGATTSSLDLVLGDEGKYFMVTVQGSGKYAGKQDSQIFGPVKGVVVTWPTATPIVYGQPLSQSILGEGSALINGIIVDGHFNFNDPAAVPTKAGTYKAAITFTPNDLSKYKVITSQIDVTVEKSLLIVTVGNATVTYGDPVPTYSYTVSGFVMGDDETALSGMPSITSLYTPGIAVSYSPIQIIGELGTLSSENYDFTFVFGELIVNKKVLTISGLYGLDKTYDGTTVAHAGGKAYLVGVFSGDGVTLGGYPSFTFAQKLAGDNIRITVRGYTLRGAKAVNYTLVQPTLYADILPLVIP